MKEYNRHIEHYFNYWHADFSRLVPDAQWGDKWLAEEYLKKYWLSEQEYLSIWKPIQDNIFLEGKCLPDLVFKAEYELIALTGGCLFLEDDFRQFQKALQEVGEAYFVVIQNSQEFTTGEPMFRMKFPVNITWEEITSGNYISAVLLEMMMNEYYVFGNTGNFGKYAANDYRYPLDIIGFKPDLASAVSKYFNQSAAEKEEIREWLPERYKEIIV